MVNNETYRQADVPSSLLGSSYKYWQRDHLRAVLSHYGRTWRYRASKLELMSELHRLVQERGLTKRDKLRILAARKNALSGGDPLPPEEPSVQVSGRAVDQHGSGAGVVQGNGPLPAKERRTADFALLTRPIADIFEEHYNDAFPESSTARLDCVVCFERLAPNNAPKRRITSTCDHEPNVCLSCLTQSIATQFTSRVWDQIDCPSCSARLDHQDVQAFAEAEVFGRYDKHSLEGFLSGAQFQRCRQPNCPSGQQCYPEYDSFIICQECQGRTCITCDIIWHPDVSCADIAVRRQEERDAREQEENAASSYLDANSKLCPNCQVRGEKVSGCDHMTCPRCRHQYCWICFVDYADIIRQGNASHRDDCRYNSNNLPSIPRQAAVPTPRTLP